MSDPSTFQIAFDAFVADLPPKKHQSKFLTECRLKAVDLTPESASKIIEDAEAKCSQKTSRRLIRRVLNPVVDILKTYDSVICSLVQADPMPSALIWGALKVIADGAHRFTSLFETIQSQIHELQAHLRDATIYEDLYGESPELQRVLFDFYKNVLRFWCRVDKECGRCFINQMWRAAAPFSTTKLERIICDMEKNVQRINKLGDMIEKGEAKNGRFLAGQEREDAEAERCIMSSWRVQHQEDRKVTAYRDVIAWLQPNAMSVDADCLRINKFNRLSGTCEWLPKAKEISQWSQEDCKSPILWVTADPGVGKSTCAAYVIEIFRQELPPRNSFYHFYQHDQRFSVLEVLRTFTQQVFQEIWTSTYDIPPAIQPLLQSFKGDFENVSKLLTLLVSYLPEVNFFIDGLDECFKAQEAVSIVTLLKRLVMNHPQKVRFWCSSQYHPLIEALMKDATRLDLNGRTEDDLDIFFKNAVLDLECMEIDLDVKTKMLQDLHAKAKGNFLWASLMKNDLIERTSNVAEMKEFIAGGLPRDLDGEDGYYARILRRIDESHKPLASLIFSVICYAKRPLRMNELRDAIGILANKDTRDLDPDRRPWVSSLLKLFAPLVQIIPSECGEVTCQVVHSTVKTFLQKRPDILQAPGSHDEERCISNKRLAQACLRYLQQDKYKSLLCKRRGRWSTKDGQSIDGHHLLTYASKYWDKHLDIVAPSPALHQQVDDFIKSTNFGTCLQVQSLFVTGHFTVYWGDLNHKHLYRKRVLPHWYISTKSGHQTWRDYRVFVHEWGPFLSTGHLSVFSNRQYALPYAGEIDRCFFKALGSKNQLSRLQERYHNFLIGDDASINRKHQYHYLSHDGTRIRLIQLLSRSSSGELIFEIQNWKFESLKQAAILSTQTLSTTALSTNWRTYARGTSTGFNTYPGRAPPIYQSSTGNVIRIGKRIYVRSDGEHFYDLHFNSEDNRLRTYVEDVEVRNNILVVTTRRKPPVCRDERIRSFNILDESKCEDEETLALLFRTTTKFNSDGVEAGESNNQMDAETDESESETDSVESSSNSEIGLTSSSSDAQDSAYETWSEGSTEAEKDEITEDKAPLYAWSESEAGESSEHHVNDAGAKEKSSDEDSDEQSDDSSIESTRYGRLLDDSDGNSLDLGADDSAADDDTHSYGGDSDDIAGFRHGMGSDNGSDNAQYDSDDVRNRFGREKKKRRKEDKGGEPFATLQVYDIGNPQPKRLLQFRRPITIVPYGSPPIIHPTKSLVVWPLGDSELLFGDFEGQTWFTRKLRFSAPRSRHVSIKCHFSECGHFLHIAALEARERTTASASSRKLKAKKTDIDIIKAKLRKALSKQLLNLSMLVSTYRLSSRKTTRSPPWLIHRVKVSLGTRRSISVSHIPVNLTWRAKEVFISCSDNELVVSRVQLFPANVSLTSRDKHGQVEISAPKSTHKAVVPRNRIFLPATSAFRDVHFFPAPENSDNKYARLIIGPGFPPDVAKSQLERQDLDDDDDDADDEDEENETKEKDRNSDELAEDQVAQKRDGKGKVKKDKKKKQKKFIGPESALPLPIGVDLHEEIDLGGWVESHDIAEIPEDMGVGQLDQKVEAFDADDDCDLEPYIF